ncbi:PD-(D/E)XK nuclease-like domain-containing protein [Limibacterium fermenti]|uniref:PD-(D/E)XK nuclease-like domain-containing protein n=1 Tax=Limibacterium fermenti TaxID=3229863 RepID=UPI003A7979D7
MMEDLSGLEAGKELNPLAYYPGDYPEKQVMIDFIERHQDEQPVEILPGELSLNGFAVKDDMETYLASKKIGSGGLKEVLKTPRHFFYDWEDEFTPKEKEYFELGTFAHLAFLEPELFEMVKVAPECNLASKDGEIRMINFYRELNGGNITRFESGFKMEGLKDILKTEKEKCRYRIIKQEHLEIIQALKKNYYWYGGGIIPKILKGAMAETSFYGVDEATGLEVKVRPDYFNIEENIGVNAIISFKTTRADNIGKFVYDAARLKYEVTEGMYQKVMSDITGRKFNATMMIMLQTVPPYDVAVLWWSPDDIQLGKYKYEMAIMTVKECFDKGWFPGFDALAESGAHGIIDMKLPEWAEKELRPVDMED